MTKAELRACVGNRVTLKRIQDIFRKDGCLAFSLYHFIISLQTLENLVYLTDVSTSKVP